MEVPKKELIFKMLRCFVRLWHIGWRAFVKIHGEGTVVCCNKGKSSSPSGIALGPLCVVRSCHGGCPLEGHYIPKKDTVVHLFSHVLNVLYCIGPVAIVLPQSDVMGKIVTVSWLLFLGIWGAFADIGKEERDILMEFHRATNGGEWKNTWDLEAPVAEWFGVTLEHGHVTKIELPLNNLTGHLPKSLFQLKHLKVLNLLFNRIEGKIPATIGQASRLRVLDLTLNKFRGSIPKGIGNLSSLHTLKLGMNLLTGRIPYRFYELTGLQVVELHSNDLKGWLLKDIGRLEKLEVLNVASNHFKGPIPESIMDLVRLESLVLFNNGFWGPVPLGIGELKSLKELNLANNALSGPIPCGILDLPRLQLLLLRNNSFYNTVEFDRSPHDHIRSYDVISSFTSRK